MSDNGGCGLQTFYGDLLSRLPRREDDDDLASTKGELTVVVFDTDSVPVPPTQLPTDAIVLQRGHHDWMGYRVDRFGLFLDKPACRALGLLILSVVLHPDPEEVEVLLTHPESEMKVLRVGYRHPARSDLGCRYWATPTRLNYQPQRPPLGPFAHAPVNALPVVRLDQSDRNEQSVVGFGSDVGSINFATLLLDLGLDDNIYNEFELMGEPAGDYRGVGPISAELYIKLPGERTNYYGPPERQPGPGNAWAPPWSWPNSDL